MAEISLLGFFFFPNATNLNLSVVSTICLFQPYLQFKKYFQNIRVQGKYAVNHESV